MGLWASEWLGGGLWHRNYWLLLTMLVKLSVYCNTAHTNICIVTNYFCKIICKRICWTPRNTRCRFLVKSVHYSHSEGAASVEVKRLTPFLFVSLCLSPCCRPAPKALSEQGSSSDKKERPMSTMSEASNYTGGSDYSTFPGSPVTTVTTGTTTSTSSTRVGDSPNSP